ncbi:hypothetical protein V6N12_062408 [Hibiscus sabdariffa]|uniref:Uncharacterized protein n=1 Tax=Hibiscus sabdariffa TaxID=183260 RepID=A0ABR2F8U4_9ROSI
MDWQTWTMKPSMKPISKLEFEFEREKLLEDVVQELIYREILEYHPQMLQEYLQGKDHISFMERVCSDDTDNSDQSIKRITTFANRASLQSPTDLQGTMELEFTNQKCVGTTEYANQNVSRTPKASDKPTQNGRRMLKNESIGASSLLGV